MPFNKLLPYCFLWILWSWNISAQESEPPRPTFRLFAEVAGGYSYKLTAPTLSLGEYTRDGLAGSVRVKWGSSNLLGVGVETGWIPISSTQNRSLPSEFGPVDLSASLSAIPVMAIFSMQRLGVQLHAGLGYYRVTSTVSMMGVTMESSEWNMGFLLSLGFARPLVGAVRIGAEVKWNNIVEQQLSILSLQLRCMYPLYGE